MATAQLHRNQTKTSKWEAVFPNEQVTEQKSALFVKKLLAVAISNITYLRAIFPEHAFGDKCLEDLNLKILRDESSCPGACQVIKWVKGCFDALDKKYLKTLVIGIYVDPNNPETVIESYTFKFTYNKDGEVDIYRNSKKISSAHSAEETKKATIRLLRTLIILTNTLTSLPDNVMMTMKLFYYDDVTPADYEPPGFKASNDDTFVFEEEATNIAVGEVATPFHTVKMRVKTDSKQFEMHEEPVEVMQTDADESLQISNTGLDSENQESNQAVREVIVEDNETVSSHKPAEKMKPGVGTLQNSQSDVPVTSPSKPDSNEDEFRVRCPCGCNEDDGLMIMCSNCKYWQHGICFLITNETKAPPEHICDICAKPGDSKLEPTDPHLCGMSSIAVQATCLWRRALSACTEFKRVVAPQLARRLGIENTVAQGLINRLEKEGYVSHSSRGKKLGKTVDHKKIKTEGIPRYLRTPKSLCKVLAENDNKKEQEVNSSSKNQVTQKDASADKDVDSLVDKTNKITLTGRRRSARNSFAAQSDQQSTQSPQENKGRRGKKRAYSLTDKTEFEVTNSQEVYSTMSARKKASIVTKDIPV